MASIADLCWTSSEDLFRDVDLDTLYSRQLKTIGVQDFERYPYVVLVHTGKITIGIDLGHRYDLTEWAFPPEENQGIDDAAPVSPPPFEDSSD
jgi:hypothetical protein